jgi:hypothetical protein
MLVCSYAGMLVCLIAGMLDCWYADEAELLQPGGARAGQTCASRYDSGTLRTDIFSQQPKVWEVSKREKGKENQLRP